MAMYETENEIASDSCDGYQSAVTSVCEETENIDRKRI
jgi:hypothetical protein